MKKFLSLVLALIMTMSLVTISAGATEYRDLTDKDEIQYEEAVAVLNRIGVITGYEDGSFRPEGELTRGAAAKIIVSLLIGPEAASNLPNATAPYPDVPASHTFAGVISYCKTAKIISGYGDGTFKPGNSLTGFAFAKMLLGALGYKSEIEGFVDTGWTMNVAKVGNVTGLFDRLDFDGAAAVNRETACQLALNTLKATMVTYGGTTMVTGAQTLAVQGTQAMYVTSNNREINANINRRVISATNNELTLEFGEEHFKDLRLEHDKYDPAYDDFGHPSNEWSYKKVTIGTFKLPADFTFTKLMSHLEDTPATKEKAVGLRNYDTWSRDHRGNTYNWSSALGGGSYTGVNSPFDDATQIHINGWKARVNQTTGRIEDYDASMYNANSKPAGVPTIAEIADLTDNGVTVEVYVCPVDADFITDVVVTRTQLMKVKRLGSDYVTLEAIEPDSRSPRQDSNLKKITGYNNFALDVTADYDSTGKNSFLADVKDSNYDAYNVLKDMKAGDYVAVVPFTTDKGKTWEVGEAYAPETVSGALTNVETYANVNKKEGSAIAITVGGTSYPINEWNKDMMGITSSKLKATKKDVTLYLAKDGTALYASDVGSAEAWMVVGDYYQATSASLGGKVGWYVHGWTIKGEEVDLDLGTIRGDAEKYAPGELVHYKVADTGNGEYVLEKPNYTGTNNYKDGTPASDKATKPTGEGIYEVSQYTRDANDAAKAKQYQISKRNGALALENYKTDNTNPPAYYDTLKADGTSLPVDASDTNGAVVKHVNKTSVASTAGAPGKIAHTFKYSNLLYDGVKFIFVNFDASNGQVETIDFKDGVQNVDYQDLVQFNKYWKNIGTNSYNFVVSAAEAYVNDKGLVKAVVVKADSSEADLSKIAVITETWGDHGYQSTGAEGDRPAGYTNGAKYVTGPNFNTSEEKTGYFDKPVNVGDIVIINEKDGGIVRKYFHSAYYNNGNPDAMYVVGIKTLQDTKGKNSEAGFLIGQTGTNSSVYTLNGLEKLTATGNKDTVVYGEDRNVDLLGNKYVSGFDTTVTNNLSGLVRVDSTTKFVDLIPYKGSNIENMGDLLDYKPETLKLRLLVNGNENTDTFRHAYAVIVEAGELINDGTTQDTSSKDLYSYNTIGEVNTALTEGNVTINGTWAPTSGLLSIPAGKTLTVKGDFNAANVRGIDFGAGSKLVVTGELKGVGTASTGVDNLSNANADVTAGKVTIEGSLTFSGKMTVNGDLDVKSGKVLTITGTVTVNGNAISSDATALSGGQIKVESAKSLHITGNVGNKKANGTVQLLTITVGNGSSSSKNGYVTIGAVLIGKFVDQNVAAADAPTQKIVEVKGEIVMGAGSKLTTETFEPTKISLSAGAEITLEKGTDGTNLDVTDSNNNAVDTGNKNTTLKIGVTIEISDTSTNNKVTADQTKTETPVESSAPIEAAATVVCNEETWNAAVKAGYKPIATATSTYLWSNFLDDSTGKVAPAHGVTTMPWLNVKFTVTAEDGLAAGSKIKATVTKGARTFTAEEATVPDGGWAEGETKTFHWAIPANADVNPQLGLNRGDLSGTYKIAINWTVNGTYPTNQKPVEVTATYTEPAIVSNARDDQEFTVDGTTIKVTKAIDLTNPDKAGMTVDGRILKGEGGWFAANSSYTAAVIVKVSNPDNRFNKLKVASSAVTEFKQDSFTNGSTNVIMGIDPSNPTGRWFKIALMPKSDSSDKGDLLTTTFDMDYTGITIPAVPTPSPTAKVTENPVEGTVTE